MHSRKRAKIEVMIVRKFMEIDLTDARHFLKMEATKTTKSFKIDHFCGCVVRIEMDLNKICEQGSGMRDEVFGN